MLRVRCCKIAQMPALQLGVSSRILSGRAARQKGVTGDTRRKGDSCVMTERGGKARAVPQGTLLLKVATVAVHKC